MTHTGRVRAFLLAVALQLGGIAGCAMPPAPPRALVLADAERFAALWSAHGGQPDAAALRAGYLEPGSPGVGLFTPHRIQSAENLARAVASEGSDYRHAIEHCLPAARAMADEVEQDIARIGQLLGRSDVAPAYVLFGAGNSGGTAGPEGLALGLEVVCRGVASPAEAKARLRGFVLHEMTHVHQERVQTAPGQDTLLRQILVEGFADFVMEQASGGRERADLGREQHGLANEAALWREIQPALPREVGHSDWLYRPAAGRPADMGYWIGKRICEAYVARATDKQAAMSVLLELREPERILRDSGYRPG